MKAEIPQLIARGGGAIVNMSSLGGLMAFPLLSPYIATKHAIVGLTKSGVNS
jgi:short-subunit dehydrogenase